ncbi:FadR/GntR family transcriptional regulator [Homoserinimonas sp. OAct 916]|uniref:FadR/GntR family transcriptional regulator n=1 Tax=Homoserinimonas sp. OAct 916 TaxID=2211450 RepID=UPI002729518A|nr:FCD domain-containing protein [Homoserinimonas sp. OAct 916]
MTADQRAWRIVLETIERDLLSGALKPGDRLPGERALAAELGVGRSSVREALRVLEVLGLVRTNTGSGPLAGAMIVATPAGGMSQLMRLQVAATGFPVAAIVRTRLVLETAVVAELALAAKSAPLDEAQQLLDAMGSPALTPAEFLALDAAFHVALAEASANQVITAMMAGLRNSIEGYVLAGVARLPDWASSVDRLRAEHSGILAAIRVGDADLARTRMHDHIAGYYAETKLTDDHVDRDDDDLTAFARHPRRMPAQKTPLQQTPPQKTPDQKREPHHG